MDTSITNARVCNLECINNLIMLSKSYWQWPEPYLEKAIPLHRITHEYIRQNSCFEVITSSLETVAFFSIKAEESSALLDNLWVLPDKIGTGIGKQACDYIISLSRTNKWDKIIVLPDPPSEQFYVKMGFVSTDETVKSRVVDGPVYTIHQMILEH